MSSEGSVTHRRMTEPETTTEVSLKVSRAFYWVALSSNTP